MMCKNPLISIVVPVYNAEKYLSQCIESILAQTYKNLEVILVDDGSTDNSLSICNFYAQKDSRVQVIHKKNEGVVVARKTGYSYAKGEYLGTVDSDDWIEPSMYSDMLHKLLEESVDFVSVGYFKNYEDKEIKSKQSSEYIDLSSGKTQKLIKDVLSGEPYNLVFMQWTKLVRTEIQKNVFNAVPDYLRTGDDDLNFIYLLSYAKSAFQLEKSYYHYRMHGNSLSQNLTGTAFRNYLPVLYETDMAILKLFPQIDEKLLSFWDIQRCVSLLNRSNVNNDWQIPIYKFPYSERIIGKNIVIYGAGKVGQSYVRTLSLYENIKIVKWIDKDHCNYSFDYRKVEAVEDIKNVPFDYIVVAVLRKTVADEIRHELCSCGISDEKILWGEPKIMGAV